MAQQGFILWLTGLSGSGKSTLAKRVAMSLRDKGLRVEVLDGDVVRESLSKGLTFTKEDRDTSVRRIGFVANLLARNGVCVITAAISPYRSVRDECRAMSQAPFVEVFVDVPLEVAEKRDVKGLYKKARAGAIEHFTGISDPYEPPLNPEIAVKTSASSVDECVAKILAYVVQRELTKV